MAKRENKKVYTSLTSTHPVFTEHRWGNSANAGVNYKRSYSKTRGKK